MAAATLFFVISRSAQMNLFTKVSFRHPLVLAAVGLVLLAALIRMVSGFGGSQSSPQTSLVFFTTDDTSAAGALAALFTDTRDRLPPFDKNGKTAFRAHVFTTDGGKTRWVGYLSKYSPEGLRQLQMRGENAISTPSGMQLANRELQVKKPGDKSWTSFQADESTAITHPTGFAGSSANIEIVEP
jgi:hypothetical protein